MTVNHLVIHPQELLDRASKVKGIYWLQDVTTINEHYDLAKKVAQELTDDLDEGDGFGSSDFTFALKQFIDELIALKKEPLTTVFNPYLSIQKL